MVPAALTPNNPFEGLTIRGVRESFEYCPVKSIAAAAIFGASLYWGIKGAKKSGPFGAMVKGLIAVALMNKAKNALMSTNGRRPMPV